ncbi:valine--tRNA ligase [Candidatus Woesearchaeota archaeon]|nr:valine--tRNA ligase [Candidatus Woesearchaeota archaeon]
MELPKKYDIHESEEKWMKYWEEEKIYKFNPETKKEIFSVDTPPPTVSGKMHIGHAFSFSQQDFITRYKRMKGFEVFVPFGTDDNGLPTQRLVEKERKISEKTHSRKEFVKECLDYLAEIRPEFVQDWKKIGFAADYDIFYSTINEHCQKISQKSFIDLYQKGREYRKEAPSIWCPQCSCSIAQVEIEDVEKESFFNDIVFKLQNSDGTEKDLVIATTRPELLPACVAIFAHPDDERYKPLFGQKAKVPLFEFEVPILPDERADPEKGTGIVMCCTFGDQTDMEWYFAHNLPLKVAIDEHGIMTKLAQKYEGLKIVEARKAIIEEMKEKGLLLNQKPIKHMVNVHERCGTPIEILNTKQWFLKYLDMKEELLKAGNELKWYPEHMKNRYDNWVNGLQWDWSLSRQKFYGIPIPVWYCKDCNETILPLESQLPVDPTTDKAPIDKCPKCGGTEFIGEKDVLDTWATSSLTPKITAELFKESTVYSKLYPMNLRPQAHDIITFWLFNTVVKSQLQNNINPWKETAISGWALDPHGKKMSKSKGNAIAPKTMLEKYCADAMRYWASTAKLGEDVATQDKDFQNGQKLITKLFNASKFALMHLEDFDKDTKPAKLEAADKWVLSKLNTLIKEATDNFDKYEYSKARQATENFFWITLCDNYLEIVKDRLYNPDTRGKEQRVSGQFALRQSLLSVLKLYAPIVSFITEEIYSWKFASEENEKSIHVSSWPTCNEELIDSDIETKGDEMLKVLYEVRKFKSAEQVSMKTELSKITISTSIDISEFMNDLKAATNAKEIILQNAEEFKVEIEK